MSKYNEIMNRIYEVTGVRTQAGLAKVLGIAQPTVSDAKKRGSVPSKWYLKLFQSLGANPEWLEHGIGPKYLRAYGTDSRKREQPTALREAGADYGAPPSKGVRLVNIHSMSGYLPQFPEKSGIIGSFSVPADFDSPDLLVVRMEYSNMEPSIKRGALVGLDGGKNKIISGEIYGLILPQEGLVIRRLYLDVDGGRLDLVSDNSAHAGNSVKLEDYSGKVIGRVVWILQPA